MRMEVHFPGGMAVEAGAAAGQVPPGVLRSIDLCAVNRHILEPPELAVELLAPASAPAGTGSG